MTERDVSAVRVEQSSTSGSIGAGTDVTQHSVGELVKEVTQDLTKLFNQELALAKLEMSNEAKKAGKTAGAYAGAGVAGYFLVLFASLTLMFALASLFDSYVWAALAVTVLWAIVGAVLYSRAKKTAAQLNPKPEMTVQTLKEDAQWAKTRKS
jgi:magnesium-transporting ATPase (P-type)